MIDFLFGVLSSFLPYLGILQAYLLTVFLAVGIRYFLRGKSANN